MRSQFGILLFGVAVFFLGGVGLVMVGLDAFPSWSDADEPDSANDGSRDRGRAETAPVTPAYDSPDPRGASATEG